jgi:hypothetical protein
MLRYCCMYSLVVSSLIFNESFGSRRSRADVNVRVLNFCCCIILCFRDPLCVVLLLLSHTYLVQMQENSEKKVVLNKERNLSEQRIFTNHN